MQVRLNHPILGEITVDSRFLTDGEAISSRAAEYRKLAEEQGILVGGKIVKGFATQPVMTFPVKRIDGSTVTGRVEVVTPDNLAETLRAFRR